jgi:hypothetical protein
MTKKPRKRKRRTTRQRRLSRLQIIANRLIGEKNVVGLEKLADWMRDYEYEAESDFLRKKAKIFKS